MSLSFCNIENTNKVDNCIFIGNKDHMYYNVNGCSVKAVYKPYIKKGFILMNDLVRRTTLSPIFKNIELGPINEFTLSHLSKIYISCRVVPSLDIVKSQFEQHHLYSVLHVNQFVYIKWLGSKYSIEIQDILDMNGKSIQHGIFTSNTLIVLVGATSQM